MGTTTWPSDREIIEAAERRRAVAVSRNLLHERARARLSRCLSSFPFGNNPLVHPDSARRWELFLDGLLARAEVTTDEHGDVHLNGVPVERMARLLFEETEKARPTQILPSRDDKGGHTYYPQLPPAEESRGERGERMVAGLSGEAPKAVPFWWTKEAQVRDEREAAAKEAARLRDPKKLSDRELAERQVALLGELTERARPQHEKDAARAAHLEATFTEGARAGALQQDEDELRLRATMGSGVRAHIEEQLAAAKAQAAADPGDEAAREAVVYREEQLARLGPPADVT